MRRWPCLIFSLLLSVSALADELPDFGDSSQRVLPLLAEQNMGKVFMRQLRATGMVINDPLDVEYINGIGQRLVAAAKPGKRHFYFFFMADSIINAFAGPGGYIAVNSGLMLATRNESELAAVMAHEIAHVTQGHIARKIADASTMKYSTLLGILAGIAVGRASGSADAAQGTMAATVASSRQHMLNFSRTLEQESDRIGIVALYKAGFNSASMASFFQRLQEEERYNSQPLALLSSHPLTPDRIADVENRIALYPKRVYHSSQEYYLIKERLRVQTAKNVHEMLGYYQQTLKKKQYENKAAAEYGYALALQSSHKYNEAYQRFATLAAENTQQVIYQLAMADVLIDQHRAADAIKILQLVTKRYPDNYPVVVEYAFALLRDGQAKAAVQILNKYRLYYPDKPVPYGLLADAQAKMGAIGQAYQTRAVALVQMGAAKMAIAQLQMALKLPHNDPDTVARIKAQIQEIQQEMQE